ncbi:MAG: hypothetical protein QOJ81_1997 [Chloroflexota bacterium]|nr:hypothetical protein [Chloroflexota bacterium]
MLRLPAILLAGAFVILACDPPFPTHSPSPTATGPAAAFEIEAAQFVNTGGCGDAFIWATNAAGTAAITVEWGGAASEAWANGPFNDTQQLPNPEITVSVVEGNGLSTYYCNDVRGPGQGTTSEIEATSGAVEVAVRPDPEGFQPAGHADLRLSDVTFTIRLGSGETWRLDELVIENVSVGWLAG